MYYGYSIRTSLGTCLTARRAFCSFAKPACGCEMVYQIVFSKSYCDDNYLGSTIRSSKLLVTINLLICREIRLKPQNEDAAGRHTSNRKEERTSYLPVHSTYVRNYCEATRSSKLFMTIPCPPLLYLQNTEMVFGRIPPQLPGHQHQEKNSNVSSSWLTCLNKWTTYLLYSSLRRGLVNSKNES